MPRHPHLVLLGKRLRELRERRGMSQETFALEAGLARPYYGGVERGLRTLAPLNLIRIAATLGCEVGELFPPIEQFKTPRNRRTRSGT